MKKQFSIVIALMAAFAVAPGIATACSVCTSNESYNALRFTPVWFVGLLGWVGVTWWVRRQARRGDGDVVNAEKYFAAARKLLVVALVLYILGLHLVVVLILPLLLLKHAGLWPVSNKGDAGGGLLQKSARGIMMVLGVSVPIAYLMFPWALSEPRIRVTENRWVKAAEQLPSDEISTTGSDSALRDPFALKRFDVPGLNVIVQSFDFYFPARENVNAKFTRTATEDIVWSRGPDGRFQLSPGKLENLLAVTTGTQALSSFTYDATNGMPSSGDIIVRRKRAGAE